MSKPNYSTQSVMEAIRTDEGGPGNLVEFSAIDGTAQTGHVSLEWETAAEILAEAAGCHPATRLAETLGECWGVLPDGTFEPGFSEVLGIDYSVVDWEYIARWMIERLKGCRCSLCSSDEAKQRRENFGL